MQTVNYELLSYADEFAIIVDPLPPGTVTDSHASLSPTPKRDGCLLRLGSVEVLLDGSGAELAEVVAQRGKVLVAEVDANARVMQTFYVEAVA